MPVLLNVLDKDKQIIWENTEKIFCYCCLLDITESIKQFGDNDAPVCMGCFFDSKHLEIEREPITGKVLLWLTEDEKLDRKTREEIKEKREEIKNIEDERDFLDMEILNLEDEIYELKKRFD